MVRQAETEIDPIFLSRWSPRAFDRSEISETHLLRMLDAAHWAPSAFNYQPWRFIYAFRGDMSWDRFLSLLIPFNHGWAESASALVFFLSQTTMGEPDKPNYSHSFDTGAAWGFFALQATRMGYHAHGMSGLKYDIADEILSIPPGWRLEAAAAVGRIGAKEMLPDHLAAREEPSGRKPLAEVIGAFPKV